jgi:hypothetical protein
MPPWPLNLAALACQNFSKISLLDVAGGNPLGEYVLTFGRDENGEVYLATKTALAPSGTDGGMPTGMIYRITAIPEPAAAMLVVTALMLIGAIRTRRTNS